MENLKQQPKLTEELKGIFKRAAETVKNKNFAAVTSGIILEEIFSKYLIDKTGEDNDFFAWMKSSIDLSDVDTLDNFLDDIYKVEFPRCSDIPKELGSDNPILSSSVDQVIKSIMIRNKLIDGGNEISTIGFVSGYTSLPGEIGVRFAKVLEKYGLSSVELFSIAVSKLKSVEDVLKSFSPSEKTIDFSKMLDENNSNNEDKRFSDDEFEKAGENAPITVTKSNPNSKTPYLDQFSFPMSTAEKYGKYDKVIGRDKEISQIVEILCCRKKNNAVLLGDPGCGKTAVVEGLVQKINNHEVPKELWNKKIYSLDLNALVSGTKYRGEYEQRLQEIIKEVCSNPDVIIYIDEFHNLVGNGGSAGNGDGANILKPYLARGEFQCIGSTTVDEYRKFIEKDGALKRRFQNVMIDEPNLLETEDILMAIKDHYSKFHKVNYSEEVVKACVEWSGRYITDRFFPDKAIDCLDMSGSLTKLNDKTGKIDYSIVEGLEKELEILVEDEKTAIEGLDFEEAGKVLDKKKQVIKKLEKAKSVLKSKEDNPKNWPIVTLETVASVISKISKVPVDKISQTGLEKMKNMKTSLESKVIGQEEAIGNVVLSLQRNYLGLRDENKPIATMLFVGPTGTGKSLICKEIAKEFFGSEKSLIRFDMGEFGERHEVTKLTGSTASYVGYDDTPLLEQVRRNPYSVVLFDEIEKAAPEIYNIFLNILDEGSVTLGNGTKVDFKNTIIIFTGNIGTKELALRGDGIGFSGRGDSEKIKKDNLGIVMKAIKKEFKPEFINRLSNITVFNELTKENFIKIFELELDKLRLRLEKKNLNLEVSDDLRDKIISECDMKFGARDLQRNITKWVENEICNSLLDVKSLDSIITIKVSLGKNKETKVTFVRKSKPKKTVKKTVTEEESEEVITGEESNLEKEVNENEKLL